MVTIVSLMTATTTDGKTERAPIAILGVPFDNVNLKEALAIAGDMIASGRPHYAAAVDVDFIAQAMDDVELRRILFDAHLVLAGDRTVVWASKVLGNELPGSVAVSDLIPGLFELAAEKKWRVYLLGADEAVAEKIRQRHPQLQLAGAYAPPARPLLEMDHADTVRRIQAAKPDILLVALGAPTQEKWINMNYRQAGVPLVLGAGLTFDFLTGQGRETRRAGKQFSKFIRAVLKQWWRLRSKRRAASGDANVIPDPYGNLVIRAPMSLDAATVEASQAEWMRAADNSHVMFDLTETAFADSTGIGALIRLRRQARQRGWQFFLVAPRPPVEAALKMMKLDEFFSIHSSFAEARLVMESAARTAQVSSGIQEAELQIRWNGEVTALNAIELGAHTESELSQASPGMNVVIDLSRVTFVDSTGIGLMVRFKKNLKRRNLNLKFLNPVASVRNVVRQTQLEEFLFG